MTRLYWLLLLTGCASLPSVSHRDTTVLYYSDTADGGYRMCSAVRIRAGTYLTAAHCTTGSRSRVVDAHTGVWAVEIPGRDQAYVTIAARESAPTARRAPVPHEGSLGVVSGYGCRHGHYQERAVRFGASGTHRGLAWGLVCPGDSGGGVWDLEGRLVGTIVETGVAEGVDHTLRHFVVFERALR